MRISDWSSDVCSSDLGAVRAGSRRREVRGPAEPPGVGVLMGADVGAAGVVAAGEVGALEQDDADLRIDAQRGDLFVQLVPDVGDGGIGLVRLESQRLGAAGDVRPGEDGHADRESTRKNSSNSYD